MYDGDTIVITTENGTETDVRLLGINAPEEDECYHHEASQHLIETLKGHEVGLMRFGTDQYGRDLAHVWDTPSHVGDVSSHVNLRMVAAGFAIATTPHDDDPYAETMFKAETSAFESRSGLWSPGACGADGPLAYVTVDVVTYDPAGPDEGRLAEELVVILNQGSDQVDLAGWVLRDESSLHRLRFPEGAFLASGGSLMINSADPGWDPGATPVWNNDGDMALLIDQEGRVVGRHRY